VILPVGTFGTTTRQIDATGLILRFFDRRRLDR
jgi:hypothetical protein